MQYGGYEVGRMDLKADLLYQMPGGGTSTARIK